MGDHRTRSSLTSIFRELSDRVGRLERAGVAPPTYTTATLPAATTVKEGTIVYVSDGGAGAKVRYSDGTAWQNLG